MATDNLQFIRLMDVDQYIYAGKIFEKYSIFINRDAILFPVGNSWKLYRKEDFSATYTANLSEILNFLKINNYSLYTDNYFPKDYWTEKYNFAKNPIVDALLCVLTQQYIYDYNINNRWGDHKQQEVDELYEEGRENAFHDHVRPEMLELYQFFKDWKKEPDSLPITLICGNKKLKLDNSHNWIFEASSNYLKEHLANISSVEQAKDELAKYKKNAGRKVNALVGRYVYFLDKIHQEVVKSQVITNDQCRFTLEALQTLNLPPFNEYDDDSDGIKKTRGHIKYIREYDIPAREEKFKTDLLNRKSRLGEPW